MRILVTGSNGLLGTKLIEAMLQRPGLQPLAASRGPCANGFLGDFPFYPLDVTDQERTAAVVQETAPDVVVHTAAMTDVDGCERAPDAARAINVTGTANVADACARAGAHLVHLSTEYVFDGRAGPYGEDDPPNPLGVYARTKLESERVVAAQCPNWAVARTTVLYGYAPNVRPNFVLWLLDQLAQGQPVRVVDDQIGSPTLADNLAEMVLALAEHRARGVYHTVGASRIDRYHFAQLAAEVFGLDAGLIAPVSTAALRQPAPRPLAAGLSVARFQHDFPAVPVLTAREGLERLRGQLAAAGRLPAQA
ncbi:MAG TPA: dTDP-4-dehydrorhamnose reductase [Chloroflexota bacterium]|nr:dTDP-4-dehydrorhamnose reductase [Chloroflexota bacterium]